MGDSCFFNVVRGCDLGIDTLVTYEVLVPNSVNFLPQSGQSPTHRQYNR